MILLSRLVRVVDIRPTRRRAAPESSLLSAKDAILLVVRGRLAESFGAFRAVFANPNLRRVELAWAGSETGKWMYVVAVGVFAYNEGGAGAVALVALIRVIPAAIIAPFAAVVSDRFRRERVMLFADVTRTISLVGAGLAVMSSLPAGIVYALAGLVAILSTTFRPAQSALLPTVSDTPEELTAANVAMSKKQKNLVGQRSAFFGRRRRARGSPIRVLFKPARRVS